MLKKHRFYCYFLKGQEGHEDTKAANNSPARGVWEGVEKALDYKCDGYMCGLGGAKKRKC